MNFVNQSQVELSILDHEGPRTLFALIFRAVKIASENRASVEDVSNALYEIISEK